MPLCRKLRPIRKFIPTATQPRVRRVPPSKLTARLRHSRACSTTAHRPPGPTIGTPAQNKTAPVEESRSPSKTDECKSPSANDRTTTKKADETDCVGADAEDGAPSDGIKVTPGPVLVEDASGTENSKPRGEEKQATASDPGDPTAVQTAIDQKIPSADAFAGPAADSRIASRAIPRSRPPDFADC